jgi:hypothetical protein
VARPLRRAKPCARRSLATLNTSGRRAAS